LQTGDNIGLCLPACSRYDDIAPVADDLHTWLLASGVEQHIIKHHFSSYFTRAACLPLFQRLEEYGYLGKDMSRRWQLVKEVSD
jgi:hypothetical protein